MRQSSPIFFHYSLLAAIPKASAPLRRQVLYELRQSIISGRLNPGKRLVERELISMMGVSRTVIREALRQLESEGLVAIIPNKGPVVRTLTLGRGAGSLRHSRGARGACRTFVHCSKRTPAEVQQLEDGVASEQPKPTIARSGKNLGDEERLLRCSLRRHP